jgi:SPP1 gp7 family putative phage head morphogenesis protein
MQEEMVEAILPLLSEYVRQDAVFTFSTMIDAIEVKYATKVERDVGPLFDRHAKSVASENAKALRVIGIRPSDLRLGSVIATKRNENLRLIEKAQRSYAQDVRELFEQPETFGLRVEEIKQRLLERGSVWDSRAELIARDQTLKLNGAITQTRQENAGISRYTWSTSLDERVRPEHAVLEGQVFDWNAPPSVGHPGWDYQCRCVAIPVIEGLDL